LAAQTKFLLSGIFSDISHQPDLRAFHAADIPIVFGTYGFSPFGPPTNNEIALSKYVQAAWVAFAKDPQNGLVNYGWPRYNPLTNSLAVLGNSVNQSGVIFENGATYDLGCVASEAGGSLALILINLLGSVF